jgi:hypothetical protein
MIYDGHCHCGAVRFRFESEPITRGIRCNCSICIRRVSAMSEPYVSLLSLDGRDALQLYQWGDRDVQFWFCRRCGVHPFHSLTAEPERYRVNLGCVDGLDPLALELRLIDGRSFP